MPDTTSRPDPVPRQRARAGAVLAPLGGVAVWLAPLPLPTDAHRLAAIFVVVVVAWVTEAIPIAVTALLIAPAMIAAGVTDAKTAFAPYADPLLFLFVGGFFIARAMTRHGLDRRLARSLVSLPFIRGSASRSRAALMVTGLLLSMWISNTAATAILLPILLGLMGADMNPIERPDESPRGRALTGSLLAVAYGCSIGGLATLVGSPPNAICARFIRQEGIEFGFFDWMKIGAPTSLAILFVIYALFHRWSPAELAPPPAPDDRVPAARAPWSKGEKVTALSFVLAVVGWILPGALKAADAPGAEALNAAMPSGGVALVAASVLFMFDDGRTGRRVLPWNDAAQIDWGIIMLFGGGISLGTQMLDTGLAAALSRGFVQATGVTELWTLTALVTVFTIFFTEACSNTATSNMLTPLVIAVASELGVSPIPPALAVGLAASCAFMLPIATGPNAIAYGTGRVPLPAMIRVGFGLNLACAAVVFGAVRALCPLFGWV